MKKKSAREREERALTNQENKMFLMMILIILEKCKTLDEAKKEIKKLLTK